MKYLIKLLLIIFFIGECYAKSGEGHYYDMSRIFPFDESAYSSNNKSIYDFYSRVNAYLDYSTFPHEKLDGKKVGNPPFLRKYEQLKNMRFPNHRIWYHWGFNKNPRQFRPLVEVIKDNLEKGYLLPEHESFFWKKLEENISERNKVLLSEWAKLSGYSGLRQLSRIQREQSNAFVTLLISIHLLGDHTTTEVNVIINRESLYGEIFNAIDNLAGRKDKHNIEVSKSLKKKLNRAKNDPQEFLNVLAKNFTPFLYNLKGESYNYKKRFKDRGFKLKK